MENQFDFEIHVCKRTLVYRFKNHTDEINKECPNNILFNCEFNRRVLYIMTLRCEFMQNFFLLKKYVKFNRPKGFFILRIFFQVFTHFQNFKKSYIRKKIMNKKCIRKKVYKMFLIKYTFKN